MSFWTAAVIIVLIWAMVQIFTRRHDRDLGVTRDEDGNPVFAPRDDAATRREIDELRERIKVLERIATDGDTLGARETRRIAADIEALRDPKES
jgi:CRISPR/Cas system-associated protein Cas5 (RAMP superfamily)